MSRVDLSTLMYAAYALTGSEESWLGGLVELLEPLMGAGFGVAAWAFAAREWGPARQYAPGVSSEVGEALRAAAEHAPQEVAAAFFLGPRSHSGSERLGGPQGFTREPAFAPVSALGISDFRCLTLLDPTGAGVAFAAPSARVVRTGHAYRSRLERIGAHILAGFRLRRSLGAIEAVLTSDGKLLDASGEACASEHRDSLRAAVKAFDRAACQPADTEALDAWRALIAGRWSLVQSFESDGRRYLVARRNPPGTVPASGLSALEAHALLLRAQGASFKLIAYELGVSVSAAHSLMHRGCTKLGIGSASELPAFVARGVREAAS